MIFRIYEEDLVEAGFTLEERISCRYRRITSSSSALPGTLRSRSRKKGQITTWRSPMRLSNNQFEDSTYEHPLPLISKFREGRSVSSSLTFLSYSRPRLLSFNPTLVNSNACPRRRRTRHRHLSILPWSIQTKGVFIDRGRCVVPFQSYLGQFKRPRSPRTGRVEYLSILP